MIQDPVCEAMVNEEQAQHWVIHRERQYWFCSSGCKRAFLQDPDRYALGELHQEELTIDWEDDPTLPERPF